jgi:thymidylate synthase ThyX
MNQIKATIISDSITPAGKRITSFELEYPRFIHAELMTHRQFSRNAASSRAIPVSTTSAQIKANPAVPFYFGSNQKGMQAGAELTGKRLDLTQSIWKEAATSAAEYASILSDLGLHKQHANRVSEVFQTYKVVLTTTEIANFLHLRDHPDAQPEIRLLASYMNTAMEASTPKHLNPGEWHLPYTTTVKSTEGKVTYLDADGTVLTEEEAIKVSASCCAQVSYRVLDHSLPKALAIYDQLVSSEPVHASPFEHQATPMKVENHLDSTLFEWQEGVTHVDKNGYFWSGNFQGWIQNRQLIPNHVIS